MQTGPRLAGKNILVTGGASGIGRAASLRLGVEGARVCVADIASEGVRAVADEIESAGGQAEPLTLDVTDGGAVAAAIANFASRNGRLDGAFNNAGIEGPALRTLEYPDDAWDRVLDVNLKGVWWCMKAELSQMMSQGGGGSIVNTASVAGIRGFPGASAYVASKHGVVGLTRSAAVEYARHGIRVNAICPGFIKTPMADRVGEAGRVNPDAMGGLAPIGRMGEAREIGDAASWLLSDEAGFTTGVALEVDGGYAAR